MCQPYHHDVRTTLTLDPDVASQLKAEVRRSGKSLNEVVNEALRLAFAERSRTRPDLATFEIRPRDLERSVLA
jgi:ribbon-helix-helix CopG family protein